MKWFVILQWCANVQVHRLIYCVIVKSFPAENITINQANVGEPKCFPFKFLWNHIETIVSLSPTVCLCVAASRWPMTSDKSNQEKAPQGRDYIDTDEFIWIHFNEYMLLHIQHTHERIQFFLSSCRIWIAWTTCECEKCLYWDTINWKKLHWSAWY